MTCSSFCAPYRQSCCVEELIKAAVLRQAMPSAQYQVSKGCNMEMVDNYFADVSKTMQALPVEEINKMVKILHEARLNGQNVFVMGNGGSAATATHFVCDLIKNTRSQGCPDFRVIGLSDNMATFSAYGNDEGYHKVFSNQLASLARPGDVVVAISTSGKSPNVLEAVKTAQEKETITIGLTGSDGGLLGDMVQLNVHVPNRRADQVEDIHLIVLHSVTAILREMAQPTVLEAIEAAPVSVLQLKTADLETIDGQRHALVYEPTLQSQNPLDRILLLLEGLKKDRKSLLERPDLLGAILLEISRSLEASSGSFALLDEHYRIASASLFYSGKISNANMDKMGVFIKSGLAGWAVKNRQPALLESTHKDRRWVEGMQTGTLHSARSVLCVPLISDERVVGVVTLSRPASEPFSGKEMLILTGIIAALTSHIGSKKV